MVVEETPTEAMLSGGTPKLVRLLDTFLTRIEDLESGGGGGGSPPTGAAGGDLSGTYPNPVIDPTISDLFLTADEKAALDAANAPDGANPFATLADVGTPFDPLAIPSDLLPDIDATRGIGSEGFRWTSIVAADGFNAGDIASGGINANYSPISLQFNNDQAIPVFLDYTRLNFAEGPQLTEYAIDHISIQDADGVEVFGVDATGALKHDLLPDSYGAYSIGSDALRWAALYLSGALSGRGPISGLDLQLLQAGQNIAASADRVFLDPTQVGVLASFLEFGTGNPAEQGVIRLANTESIFRRNALNDGDIDVLGPPGTLSDTDPGALGPGAIWVQPLTPDAETGYTNFGVSRVRDATDSLWLQPVLAAFDGDLNLRGLVEPLYKTAGEDMVGIRIVGYDAAGTERARANFGDQGDTMELQTFDATGQQRNDISVYDEAMEFNHVDADGVFRSRFFAGAIGSFDEDAAGLESRDALAAVQAAIYVSAIGLEFSGPITIYDDVINAASLPTADPGVVGNLYTFASASGVGATVLAALAAALANGQKLVLVSNGP